MTTRRYAAALLGAITILFGSDRAAGQSVAERDMRRAASAESPLVWKTYVSIHEHPALGKQEHRTHDLLKSELQRIGYREFVESTLAPTVNDSAFYTAATPALYFGWEISRDGLGIGGVHSPEFTIHPAALVEGVRFLATLAEVATH